MLAIEKAAESTVPLLQQKKHCSEMQSKWQWIDRPLNQGIRNFKKRFKNRSTYPIEQTHLSHRSKDTNLFISRLKYKYYSMIVEEK